MKGSGSGHQQVSREVKSKHQKPLKGCRDFICSSSPMDIIPFINRWRPLHTGIIRHGCTVQWKVETGSFGTKGKTGNNL